MRQLTKRICFIDHRFIVVKNVNSRLVLETPTVDIIFR